MTYKKLSLFSESFVPLQKNTRIMSTITKKTTKKATNKGLAGAEKKKVNYVIDPETGKKVHRRWLNVKKLWAEGGGIEIVDMRAVLK